MKPLRTIHAPHHWIPVAMVLAAALFTLSEAHGQHTGAGAVFEGRPAMSGAQAGQGALAGPPQGGVGVQGPQDTGVSITRPPGVTPPRDGLQPADARGTDKVPGPSRGDVNVAPRKDSVAKDQRSAVKKTRREAKKVIRKERAPVVERAPSAERLSK